MKKTTNLSAKLVTNNPKNIISPPATATFLKPRFRRIGPLSTPVHIFF